MVHAKANRHASQCCSLTGFAPLTSAKDTQAQTVETGLVKLTGADIEYFSRGKGAAVVMLPGGNPAGEPYRRPGGCARQSGLWVVGIDFRGSGRSTGSSKGSAGWRMNGRP